MLKHALIFLIPAFAFTLGIFIITETKKAEVVHVASGDGQPEAYNITASPHYRWTHGAHQTAVIIFAFLLLIPGAVYSYKMEYKNDEVNKLYIIIPFVISALLIFARYSAISYSSKYVKTVDAETYQITKDNLDINFPQ